MLINRASSGAMSSSHTLPPGEGQFEYFSTRRVDPPPTGDRSVPAMSTQTTTRTDTGWGPLAVLMCGTFLVVLDFFIVNVALPSMQRELHASDSGLEWVVAGYGLTFSALLIAVTRLGDRIGRRRMFSLGTAL